MIQDHFPLDEGALRLDAEAMKASAEGFAAIEAVRDENQWHLLRRFTEAGVAAHHLTGSTGYGYDDAGRERLEAVFAAYTGSEAALMRHQFMSGTHTLAVALFGVLRPGDTLLCASGAPYDTLHSVLGLSGEAGQGSLADFGVQYRQLELENGRPNLDAIRRQAAGSAMLYLQRSRGYADRPALSCEDIEAAAGAAREVNPGIVVLVDNCYGEFTGTSEPTCHGADLIAGSLIKNPGGGIAPTGGYIAGKEKWVERCAARLTAPGVGAEIGSTSGDLLRQIWLGLYFAPAVTAEAMKTAVYASALFGRLGYRVSPETGSRRSDIITAITLGSAPRLEVLCAAVQQGSPVDSFATPRPAPMPGYNCDIIMAAGAFTQGSSIELSCDAPLREPYTAYLQGGLNFAASRAALLRAAQAIGPANH